MVDRRGPVSEEGGGGREIGRVGAARLDDHLTGAVLEEGIAPAKGDDGREEDLAMDPDAPDCVGGFVDVRVLARPFANDI
jgi:hypothetical protein